MATAMLNIQREEANEHAVSVPCHTPCHHNPHKDVGHGVTGHWSATSRSGIKTP